VEEKGEMNVRKGRKLPIPVKAEDLWSIHSLAAEYAETAQETLAALEQELGREGRRVSWGKRRIGRRAQNNP
jgi:hypothetical protein